VILISLDTLRADRLGSYGYSRDTSPSLDGFADESFLFTNAFSPAAYTLPAHVSMFLSKYPSSHGVLPPTAIIPEREVMLAEILSEKGLATAGFHSTIYTRAMFGFDQGFDMYEHAVGNSRQASAPDVNEKAVEWLQEHGEERFFLFLHYMDAHIPNNEKRPGGGSFWEGEKLNVDAAANKRRRKALEKILNKAGIEVEIPRRVNRKVLSELKTSLEEQGVYDRVAEEFEELMKSHIGVFLEETEREYVRDRYDDGVAYLDFHLGSLFTELKRLDVWDRSVIIITSDHGEMLFDHRDFRAHDFYLYNALIRVPLLLRAPGYPGGRSVENFVSTVDLVPTVLELLKVDYSGDFEGSSLVPLLEGEREGWRRPLLSETSRGAAIIADPWKLILDYETETTELYDVSVDPGEETDLAKLEPEVAARLEQELRQMMAQNRAASAGSEVELLELDADMVRNLRALGYLNAGPEERP
jgi:arylsulfatase A-like enzyme